MTSSKHARAAQADPETPRQEGLHREIARRYAWHDLERRARRRPKLFCHLRLRQLERLFADRYGCTLPDDDAGRDDLYVAAMHIADGGAPELHITAWASLWAPWASAEHVAALVAKVIANPRRWRAETLGWRQRLTDTERTRLEITTIAPIDCTKAERAKRSKERKQAVRKASRKADAAARPAPAARTKPWEAAGVSRASWYRRRPETVRLNVAPADTSRAGAEKSLTPTPSPAHKPQAVSVSAWLEAQRAK
jgi:hypothetical protein